MCFLSTAITRICEGSPHGVTVKELDYNIVVSELELHLRYFVQFRTYILNKGMNPLFPLSYGWNTTFLL